jgi:hypothetical protein
MSGKMSSSTIDGIHCTDGARVAFTRQTHALFMSDIDHESIEQIVKTTKRHKNEERLLWDIFKIPHHRSYTAIGPDKGVDETKPTDEVKWLCETQGQERHTMMPTSKSIPIKGSDEDKDVQPPHRQAAAYYKRVAAAKDGQFKVTMDLPPASRSPPRSRSPTAARGCSRCRRRWELPALSQPRHARGKMALHPWWSGFGQAVTSADDLTSMPARELVSAVMAGVVPAATMTGLKACAKTGHTAVALEIEVERPQDLAHPIRATEPIAVVFDARGGQPHVLALRDDFPDTPHQNWTPQDAPCSLCVDDRPWPEARLRRAAEITESCWV